jgi:hypothetical protein
MDNNASCAEPHVVSIRGTHVNLAWWCGSLVRLCAYIRLAQVGASWRKASHWPESSRRLSLGHYGERCPAYIRLAQVDASWR